ncbi:nickel-dependent hydrogenase large subunit [Bradyrhizobium monzae]
MPDNRPEVVISLLILRSMTLSSNSRSATTRAKRLMMPMSAWSRPRTAARHWMAAGDGRIERYQINAPTTWNFSPRISFDADGML